MQLVPILLILAALALFHFRDAVARKLDVAPGIVGLAGTLVLLGGGAAQYAMTGHIIGAGLTLICPILPYQLISRDAQIALTEFRQEFAEAFAGAPPELVAGELGLGVTVAPGAEVRFPIPVSAAGYHLFTGDVKYRALAERSLKIKPLLFQDGVEELARVIEAPDFIGWAGEPGRIALAAQHLPNQLIAQLLEGRVDDAAAVGSPGACDLDGINFFDGTKFSDGTHPFNIFKESVGAFGNNFTKAGVGFSTTPSIEVLEYAAQSFRRIKNPSGLPGGYKLTHIVAPPEQEMLWTKVITQNLLVQSLDAGATFGSVDNVWKGRVKLLILDNLKDTGKFYTVSGNKTGCYPWMYASEGAPEEIIRDKTDSKYKDTLKVGVAYILAAAGGLALPHTIQRWSGEA